SRHADVRKSRGCRLGGHPEHWWAERRRESQAFAAGLQTAHRFPRDSSGSCVPEFHERGSRQLGLERKHLWLRAMDLPEAKGSYVLICSVAQMKRLTIGRLGSFDIVPGFYAYVGSAFGAGGLRARIGHHLESTADPHWHIDYLLTVAEPVEVWYSTAKQKLEHHWAERLGKEPQFRIPIPRFGSSDYHRSRS